MTLISAQGPEARVELGTEKPATRAWVQVLHQPGGSALWPFVLHKHGPGAPFSSVAF